MTNQGQQSAAHRALSGESIRLTASSGRSESLGNIDRCREGNFTLFYHKTDFRERSEKRQQKFMFWKEQGELFKKIREKQKKDGGRSSRRWRSPNIQMGGVSRLESQDITK